MNDYDRVVIERVYSYIKPFSSQDHGTNQPMEESKEGTDEIMDRQYYDTDEEVGDYESDHDEQGVTNNRTRYQLKCAYTLDVKIGPTIGTSNRVTTTWNWHNRYRQKLGVAPSHFIGNAVANMSLKYTSLHELPAARDISVTGYTSAVINGQLYKATPWWKGDEWYDWACVKFPRANDSDGDKSSICRIIGFVEYTTPGAFTYKLMEIDDCDPGDVAGVTDSTLYAILHCQTSFFSYTRLQSTFFRRFKMVESGKMVMVPASCIRGPVLVVPDMEGPDTASSVDYLATLPQHKQSAFFKHHMQTYLNDDSEGDDIPEAADDQSLYGDNW